MAKRRPGSVTAAGVMAIIYGSLFTLCGLCGAVGLVAQGALGPNFMGGGDPNQAKMQRDLEDALQREAPAYRAYQVGTVILGLAESVTLLIAGIGLIGMHSWARTLAIVAGLITILSTTFQAVYQTVFVMPAMNRAFQVIFPAAMPNGKALAGPQADQLKEFMQNMMTAIAIGSVILYVAVVVYLLIVVLLLLRGNVRAAFAGADDLSNESARLDRLDRDEEDEGWGASRPPDDQGHYR